MAPLLTRGGAGTPPLDRSSPSIVAGIGATAGQGEVQLAYGLGGRYLATLVLDPQWGFILIASTLHSTVLAEPLV
jgi:hypothetical protein